MSAVKLPVDLTMRLDELLAQAATGDQRATARLASIVERQNAETQALRGVLGERPRNAHRVGVTGSPGVGKSSLIARMAEHLSSEGKSVAVVAVDPSSKVTGGATLGDRIRMAETAMQPGVFVRSLASRSSDDGLAPAAFGMVNLFDTLGYDYVLLETVGAGQNQIAIANAVHTLVLIEAPGAGDSVQMLKAGLMEVADIYAVTKADLPGAHLIGRELRAMVFLGSETTDEWTAPIILCSAESGDGIRSIVEAIDEHSAYLARTALLGDSNRLILRSELEAELNRLVAQSIEASLRSGDLIKGMLDGTVSMKEAVQRVTALLAATPAPHVTTASGETRGER